MILPVALFVAVCAFGSATGSAIPRDGSRSRNDASTRVSKVVPPPIGDAALMARFIVNQADWTALATISTRKDVPGYPVSNVIALSDGMLGSGSGVPYMFMTPLDFSAQDIAADPRATLLMTLAQGDYCKDKVYDPMDPRCARVMITGKIVEVKPEDAEIKEAKSAMFGRHPWLAHMPENHHFFFAKVDIETIVVLDHFGGPKYVTPEEYYNAGKKPQAKSLGRPFWPKPLNKPAADDVEEPKFVYRV